MPTIIKILGTENKQEYAIVHVLTSDGDEASVWVGGAVEVYFHKGKIKAFVKKP
jgi:hypothetical protein